MSDGNPTLCHRITKSYFRTCSARRRRSQAPFCLCALRMVSVHSEGTFERLRYPFGGDRPSQTPRQTLSPGRFHGRRLETQCCRGGIPTAALEGLASFLLSLPPILYVQHRIPASSWSKAPWGLHYAFRAGRNLPDKEFRYLRTVIVTAAVYWGLNSGLRFLSPPLNLPAPGRRQPIYFTLRFRIDLCFC